MELLNGYLLQYKFRVMSASIAGISEASPQSEEVSDNKRDSSTSM